MNSQANQYARGGCGRWGALLTAFLALVFLLASPPRATAQPGTVVAGVEFDTGCAPALGVGIAFDGTNLWFSCTPFFGLTLGGGPDLFRATTAGVVTASYKINTTDDKGIGALAYDVARNGIWVGWGDAGGGGSTLGKVWFVSLDGAKNVVSSVVVGDVSGEVGIIVCGLDDGLAYDGLTDDLYFSDDCSTTIHHYDVVPGAVPSVGAHLGDFAWGGAACYNSGLAVGGALLYQGSNGCNHVWVVDKVLLTPAFDFATSIGEIRDEDLECDEITFAGIGKEVMWSIEAYDTDFNGDGFAHRLAGAYEIPAGSCKHGGGGGEVKGRMTGGGRVTTASRVTHGFELHCTVSDLPNNLQVNWGGNRFHLESLTSATCTNDPTIAPEPPKAGFDTYTGKGTGRYNGVSGATAEWTFTDAGEPGKSDTMKIEIKDSSSAIVLFVMTSTLDVGNHQAHEDK